MTNTDDLTIEKELELMENYLKFKIISKTKYNDDDLNKFNTPEKRRKTNNNDFMINNEQKEQYKKKSIIKNNITDGENIERGKINFEKDIDENLEINE